MAHDLADRAVAQQRHPDDEPHAVLRGQLALAERRGARRLQRLRDPLRIQRLAEELEAWRAVARAHRQDGLPQLHHPTSVGKANYTVWIKRSRIPVTYARSDRHCPSSALSAMTLRVTRGA